LRREEIERGYGVEFAALLVEHARDRAGVGVAEADAQAFDGLDERLVAPGAVEESLEGFLLRHGGRLHLQHVRTAPALRDVVGERVDRLPVGCAIGQDIGAFPHDRRAEGLQRAQHAHAGGGILGRQLRDGHQPGRHGRWHLILPTMHFDKELDARGLNCPLPILRTKKALAELQSGQVLKVLATDPGAVKDFQAFSRQTGHELVSHNEERKEFTFFMRKK